MVCEMLAEGIIRIEFGPVVKEVLFIDISLFSSGSHFVQQSKLTCAMLVEAITRNISMKLY